MYMNVYSLLVALSFMFAGNSLQLMIVLSRAELEGFTEFQVALLACTYFIGFFVGCRYLPKILSSFGHIRFFSAVASISSASVIAYLIFVEPYFWATLRFFSGFCISGMLLTAESWLTSASKGIGSMKLFSTYRLIGNLSNSHVFPCHRFSFRLLSA